MNRSLALISITLFLISCSAERQDTKPHQLNPLVEEISEINQRSTAINDGQAKASSTLSEDSNLTKTSIQKTFCLDKDISNWYGFKEQEWASVAVPNGLKLKNGTKSNGSKSFYEKKDKTLLQMNLQRKLLKF